MASEITYTNSAHSKIQVWNGGGLVWESVTLSTQRFGYSEIRSFNFQMSDGDEQIELGTRLPDVRFYVGMGGSRFLSFEVGVVVVSRTGSYMATGGRAGDIYKGESFDAPRNWIRDHPLWSPEFDALLTAVNERPNDDLPKDVLCDWLEENGQWEGTQGLRHYLASPLDNPMIPNRNAIVPHFVAEMRRVAS